MRLPFLCLSTAPRRAAGPLYYRLWPWICKCHSEPRSAHYGELAAPGSAKRMRSHSVMLSLPLACTGRPFAIWESGGCISGGMGAGACLSSVLGPLPCLPATFLSCSPRPCILLLGPWVLVHAGIPVLYFPEGMNYSVFS